MKLITKYPGKYGQDIVIAEMDDYHLANAFNYFARQLYKVVRLIYMEGSTNDERVMYETDMASADWLKSMVYSLGTEAARRGRKSTCTACDGFGVNNSGGPCLMCCGTGWFLGVDRKELENVQGQLGVL